MNVTFYQRESSIWVNVRYKQERYRLPINVHIDPKFWGKGKVKPKAPEARKDAKTLKYCKKSYDFFVNLSYE